MAARVLLLMACTGLFATAWNSDHPPAARPALASKNRRLPDRPSAEDDRRSPFLEMIADGIAVSSDAGFSMCRLPDGITPGTYRVIDGCGRVGWVSIPMHEAAIDTAKEIYASERDSEHWYFIRIADAPIIATSPAAKPVRR